MFSGSDNLHQHESCGCSICVPDSGDDFVKLLKTYKVNPETSEQVQERSKMRTIELPELANKCFRDELYLIAEAHRSANFKGAKLIGYCELSTPVIEKVLSELEYISEDGDLKFIDSWKIRRDILLLIYEFFRDIDIDEHAYQNMESTTDSEESDSDLHLDLRNFLNDSDNATSESGSDYFNDETDLFDNEEEFIEDIERLMI